MGAKLRFWRTPLTSGYRISRPAIQNCSSSIAPTGRLAISRHGQCLCRAEVVRRLGNIQAHDATWSPDGKRIAFAKGSNILLADAYGTNLRQLISVEGNPSMMRFSPDGTRIRFSLDSPDDTANSIWEVRSDGKDLHPLMPGWHNPAQECCGIWTPDGRYYLFTSGDANNIQVYALRESRGLFRKSSTPYQLTSGPMFFLIWCSDSRREEISSGWHPPSIRTRTL